jgi:mono/diheme cytochrome c family protein
MMKKIILIAVFFGAIIFSVQSCGGNNTPASGTDTAKQNATVSAYTDGKNLYEAKCITCHGADGAAGIMGAADLSKSALSHDAAIAIVKNGKNAMKAFGSELDDAGIEAVVKYVETFKK